MFSTHSQPSIHSQQSAKGPAQQQQQQTRSLAARKMAGDDDLTFDFEHQLEEEPEPLAALPVRAAAGQQTKTAASATGGHLVCLQQGSPASLGLCYLCYMCDCCLDV